MRISTPELNVVRFANEDVIATSIFITGETDPDTGMYKYLYGSMSSSGEDGTWNVGYESTGWLSDYEFSQAKGEYDGNYTFGGETVYDAYKIGDDYYTKGVSYYELYGNQ